MYAALDISNDRFRRLTMKTTQPLLGSIVVGALLGLGCGGTVVTTTGGTGGSGGSASQGTTSGSTHSSTGSGAGCPLGVPSGLCSQPNLTCDYAGADGCPVRMQCFENLGTSQWITVAPSVGGSCATPGKVCTYEVTIGDNPPAWSALECEGGTWQPHDLCPPSAPAPGSPCSYTYLSCSYDACPDVPGAETLALCMNSWNVSSPCGPPTP